MSSVYVVVAIAFGVAGVAWLFAAARPGTARKLWKPGDTVLTIFRLSLGAVTVYVLLTAGGLVFFVGLAAVFFGGLHLYFTRPDKDLPRIGIPGPIRAFMGIMSSIERMLFGTR